MPRSASLAIDEKARTAAATLYSAGRIGPVPLTTEMVTCFVDSIELVFDTRRVTTTLEYRLACDRCHRRYPKRSSDQVHLGELARDDGWVRDGKRDVCAERRHEATERALRELAEHQAQRRDGRR